MPDVYRIEGAAKHQFESHRQIDLLTNLTVTKYHEFLGSQAF